MPQERDIVLQHEVFFPLDRMQPVAQKPKKTESFKASFSVCHIEVFKHKNLSSCNPTWQKEAQQAW